MFEAIYVHEAQQKRIQSLDFSRFRNCYILIYVPYTGKSAESVSSNDTLGERVILNSRKNLRHNGSLIAFGNFFTLVTLMYQLEAKRIFAVGTMRTSRKDPSDMLK